MILAGEVESTGKAAKRFKKGDQVYGVTIKSAMHPRLGTYAEYKCLPDDSFIVSKPSNTTYEEAAAVPYGGLFGVFSEEGENSKRTKNSRLWSFRTIGTSAVQLALYFGATVTGVCSTSNVELVKSLGADTVLDYTKEDFTDTGELYDFVFDAVSWHARKSLKLKCKNALTRTGNIYQSLKGDPSSVLKD